MDTTCWQIEYIARLYLMASQNLSNSSFSDTLLILFPCNLSVESSLQEATRLGIDDIPQLVLPHFAMNSLSHLVIRMNLYAEVLPGIN